MSYINNRLKVESIANLYQLFLTCYTAKRIKKSTTVTKVVTMKNMDGFHYTKEAITWYLTLFAVSKDEWNTKEDVECMWYAERHFSG